MPSQRIISPQKTLFLAISAITASTTIAGSRSVMAQDDDKLSLEEVVVTASRRSESVMDIPINVSAVSGDQIEDLRLDGLNEISRYVSGLQVTDNGPRDDSPNIMVRGLNSDSLGPAFNAGLVATYIGDIPIEIDFKPNDLERVEVLIGPQGTLYGAGTMGGAIRYIPNRADTSEFTLDVRGSVNALSASDGIGTDAGFTINIPVVQDVLALRLNVDQLKDKGFIDYDYVVRQAGVSDPNPNPSIPGARDANLRRVEDANGEDTLSGRLTLRWTPNDWLDANLWYFFQDTEAEGRQINGEASIGTGKYESPYRYEEPNDYDNKLVSIDIKADLGFAEATVVYGESSYDELGQRDQSDLLLDFEYGYELFPTFSSFTREAADEETQTVELRLASSHDGPFSWVAGYYENEEETAAISEEFTPGFDQFAVDNLGGAQLRPDSLEYIQLTDAFEKESAFYGEVTYEMGNTLQFTLGYRDYTFKADSNSGFSLPLSETLYNGAPPDFKEVNLGFNKIEDSGEVYKFNVSWTPDDDILLYFTFSEGYRRGGVNSVPECTPEQLASGTQQVCATVDEVLIRPDTIDNYEIGMKSTWLGGTMTTNVAIYQIDWEDLQVSDVTVNGSLPITSNGSEAESKGLEFNGRWRFSESWETAVTYAYTNVELTQLAKGLVGPLDAPAGTRLPGSPEHQGSVNISYRTAMLDDIDLEVTYGLTYTGDIMNIPGGEEEPALAPRFGENLNSYTLHHLAATFSKDKWSVQVFADNLTNKFYISGTRSSRRLLAENRGLINGRALRSYGEYVGTPRNIGVKVNYSFW